MPVFPTLCCNSIPQNLGLHMLCCKCNPANFIFTLTVSQNPCQKRNVKFKFNCYITPSKETHLYKFSVKFSFKFIVLLFHSRNVQLYLHYTIITFYTILAFHYLCYNKFPVHIQLKLYFPTNLIFINMVKNFPLQLQLYNYCSVPKM